VGEALALLKDPSGSPQTAALLAVEVLRHNRALESDAAVRQVLSALLRPARVLRSPFPNGRTLLSPSGHHVAFYQTDKSAPTRGALSIWEVLTGRELARVEVAWQEPPVQTPSGPVLTFWNDGRIVAVSAGPPSAGTEVFYYDVKTGARTQEAPTLPQGAERSEVAQGPSALPPFLPRSERIAAWSPDRQRLATLDESGNARVWDVASGKSLAAAPLGGSTLQFSRDLRWLFGRSQGTGAVVWRWAEDPRVAMTPCSRRWR
jgi:WD40 repeat protein